MARGGKGGGNRSAITGRYISNAAAARHPRTTVRESGGKNSGGTRHRSSITGEFVTAATAARHPKTTVTENGK